MRTKITSFFQVPIKEIPEVDPKFPLRRVEFIQGFIESANLV